MNRNYFLFLFICFVIPAYSSAQYRNLDFYISNAIANSPLLNESRNQILSNQIDSQVLVASKGMQLSANGTSYYAPIRNGYGYDEAITNGAQLQALFTASKNLLPKKYFNLQFKDLQLTGDSIRNAAKISEHELNRAIISQYITTYAGQLQINFNNQLQNLLQREEIILKRLTQKNVYKQVDYLSFLVTFQQQELVRQQLEVQYKSDYATLNYLAGVFDTTTTALSPPEITVLETFYPDSSAYFLKYRVDSLRLVNNKGLIGLSYKPQINLYADGGFQSSLAFQPYKNLGYSFGINFLIPIYDGGQKKMQYAKIEIAERTRLKNKVFFQTQFNQQKAQLQQQLTAIDNLLPAINKQITYIETLIEANRKLLQTGDIKMADYLLTINNYVMAKNLVLQNLISRYQVINQLNYWNK